MKIDDQTTNLPERRQIERPPPEFKPKWSKILRMAFRGILIWMPRLWKFLELILGWFNGSGS